MNISSTLRLGFEYTADEQVDQAIKRYKDKRRKLKRTIAPAVAR